MNSFIKSYLDKIIGRWCKKDMTNHWGAHFEMILVPRLFLNVFVCALDFSAASVSHTVLHISTNEVSVWSRPRKMPDFYGMKPVKS